MKRYFSAFVVAVIFAMPMAGSAMAQDDAAASAAAEEAPAGGFNLFNPLTWFGGGAAPAAAEEAPAAEPAPTPVAAEPAPAAEPKATDNPSIIDEAVEMDGGPKAKKESKSSGVNIFNPLSWFGGSAPAEEADSSDALADLPADEPAATTSPDALVVEDVSLDEQAPATERSLLNPFSWFAPAPQEEETLHIDESGSADDQTAQPVGPLEIVFAPIGWLFGPKDITKQDVWANPSPELDSLSQTHDENVTHWQNTADTYHRMFWDDLRKALLMDRPSRSTKYPIPR